MTEDDIKQSIAAFFRRGAAARAAGGIALADTVNDQKIAVPEGWTLDPVTYYYVPTNLDLDAAEKLQ